MVRMWVAPRGVIAGKSATQPEAGAGLPKTADLAHGKVATLSMIATKATTAALETVSSAGAVVEGVQQLRLRQLGLWGSVDVEKEEEDGVSLFLNE